MDNFKEIIERVTTNILEDWAMMMIEPAEKNTELFEADAPFYLTSIQYKGLMEGRYFILCQEEFLNCPSMQFIR